MIKNIEVKNLEDVLRFRDLKNFNGLTLVLAFFYPLKLSNFIEFYSTYTKECDIPLSVVEFKNMAGENGFTAPSMKKVHLKTGYDESIAMEEFGENSFDKYEIHFRINDDILRAYGISMNCLVHGYSEKIKVLSIDFTPSIRVDSIYFLEWDKYQDTIDKVEKLKTHLENLTYEDIVCHLIYFEENESNE